MWRGCLASGSRAWRRNFCREPGEPGPICAAVRSLARKASRWRSISLARGARGGRWHDLAAAQGGDALDLVAQAMFGGDLGEALKWAAGWLGIAELDPRELAERGEAARRAAAARSRRAAGDELRRRNRALALWLEARPVTPGDAVWRYLEGRSIDLAVLGHAPRALRCHPALYHHPTGTTWPAMVAAISGPNGRHVATHRTWLRPSPDGAAGKAPVAEPKLTLGSYVGGMIHLTRGVSGKPWREMPAERVALSEGIEDALSFASLMPQLRCAAAVALSSMLSLELPAAWTGVVLLRQNDPPGSAAAGVFARVVARFRGLGLRVQIVSPPPGVKDINDVLQLADV